jgi:hypothetical protein
MKKVKFMLMSLMLFALLGASIAFKARFNNVWCITTTQRSNNGAYICPNAICGSTFIINARTTINQPPVGFTTFCSTQTNGLVPTQFDICTDAVGVTKRCPNTFTLTFDGGAGGFTTVIRHS